MMQVFWDILPLQLVNICELWGFHSCLIVRSARLGCDSACNDHEPLTIKVMHSFEMFGTT